MDFEKIAKERNIPVDMVKAVAELCNGSEEETMAALKDGCEFYPNITMLDLSISFVYSSKIDDIPMEIADYIDCQKYIEVLEQHCYTQTKYGVVCTDPD